MYEDMADGKRLHFFQFMTQKYWEQLTLFNNSNNHFENRNKTQNPLLLLRTHHLNLLMTI